MTSHSTWSQRHLMSSGSTFREEHNMKHETVFREFVSYFFRFFDFLNLLFQFLSIS